MNILLLLHALIALNFYSEALPVSYREQTTVAEVVEDKNTALSNIENNFSEYCEWQALDKGLYRIEERDRTGSYFATQYGQMDYKHPFKIKDHIEIYRNAKSENSLVKAREVFSSNAQLRPDLGLLTYSQLGSPYLQSIYNTNFMIGRQYKQIDNINYFKTLLEELKFRVPITNDYKDLHTEFFLPSGNRFGRMTLEGKDLELLGLCSYISFLNGLGCQRAILSNSDLFSPKFYFRINDEHQYKEQTASVTAVPIFKDVLYGADYTEVLRKSALDFLELIASESFSKSTNAYDILHMNFKSSGLSDFEAKTKAINIMATISTGGGNFIARLLDRETILLFPDSCFDKCNMNSIYLSAIVESIVFLDHLKIKKFGNTFSFPKEIRYDCNMGDWYHFWMAAGLTRRMSLNGYTKKVSKLTTFAMSAGYHLYSGHLLTKQKFGTLINSANQDLLLSALGIRFGQDEILSERVTYSSMLYNYLNTIDTNLPLTHKQLTSLRVEQIGLKNAQLLGIRYLFHSVINQ